VRKAASSSVSAASTLLWAVVDDHVGPNAFQSPPRSSAIADVRVRVGQRNQVRIGQHVDQIGSDLAVRADDGDPHQPPDGRHIRERGGDPTAPPSSYVRVTVVGYQDIIPVVVTMTICCPESRMSYDVDEGVTAYADEGVTVFAELKGVATTCQAGMNWRTGTSAWTLGLSIAVSPNRGCEE
jgi:hypothetical protein